MKKIERRLSHNRPESHKERMSLRKAARSLRVSQARYSTRRVFKADYVFPFVYVSKYNPTRELLKERQYAA